MTSGRLENLIMPIYTQQKMEIYIYIYIYIYDLTVRPVLEGLETNFRN